MAKIKPMVWSKLFSFYLINKDKPDIFFAGDAFVPLFLQQTRIVSVVHDLNSVIARETMPRLRLITDELFLKRDLRKADTIICNSYGTADKLKRYINIEADLVIHPIIDPWYIILPKNEVKMKLADLSINFPYILSVATQEPRKNLDKTIKAFMSLKDQGHLSDYKLLLIGSKGWKSDQIDQLLQVYGDDVKHLGYIPDDMMPYLYNGADLFVFPSSYEGFGIPVREAILCGIPVVTTDIPELREASYNQAKYITLTDPTAFEYAMLETIKLKQAGDLRVITFVNNDQINELVKMLITN
ncbi:glycosyltransferase family 4 protein [Mucilaginibacter sp. HD30]